jgi:integrase
VKRIRVASGTYLYLRRGTMYYARTWVKVAGHPRGGKDRWKALGKDLEEAKREFLKLRLLGPAPEREGTVEEVALAWLSTYVQAKRTNELGRKLARSRLRDHLAPFLGSEKAHAVTSDHLLRYRSYLEAKGLKERSVTVILSDARCLFRWAAESGWIESSPWPRYIMPKAPEEPPKYLTDSERQAVEAVEDPWGFGCRIMLGSGVRFGELTRLQANDLEGDVLTIHGRTKSLRMRRVALSEALSVEIRQHVGKLVPFAAKDCSRFNRAVQYRSGVNDFSSHRCRHTYAARYAQRG